MRRDLALVIALSSALIGCSYHYAVKAVAKDGRIAFLPSDEKGTGCLSDVTVTDDAGKIVWQLNAGRYISSPCISRFPIIYGMIPSGFAEKVKALPLRENTTYKIEAWDGDSYTGRFRIRKAIVIDNFGKSL